MIHVDLGKAFDGVKHYVLFSISSHDSLERVILEGVKRAYRICTTKLIVNRKVSNSFHVLSSVRQGCPMLLLLFALYLEPYYLSVKRNPCIRGFYLQAAEVKTDYSDDIAVFCSDLTSVSAVIQTTKAFCVASGAAVNWDETCCYLYGGWDVMPGVSDGIRWSREPCNYLGVPLKYHQNSNT